MVLQTPWSRKERNGPGRKLGEMVLIKTTAVFYLEFVSNIWFVFLVLLLVFWQLLHVLQMCFEVLACCFYRCFGLEAFMWFELLCGKICYFVLIAWRVNGIVAWFLSALLCFANVLRDVGLLFLFRPVLRP